MNDDLPNIVALDDHRDAAPKLRVAKAVPCFCSFVFDEKTRAVSCARCKRVWEPFDALVFIATKWEHYGRRRDDLVTKISQLKKERVTLAKDTRRLRAQRKYLAWRIATLTSVGKPPALPDPEAMSVEDLRAEVDGGRHAYADLVETLEERNKEIKKLTANLEGAHRVIDDMRKR